MDNLKKLREDINATDARLLQCLADRRALSQRVIEEKAENERPLRDAKREEELLERLIAAGRELGLDAHYVKSVFHVIIDDSVRSQQLFLLSRGNPDEPMAMKRVAFQGVAGAYSYLAAKKFFSRDEEATVITGYPTFAQVVAAVEQGASDYGILPVENTTAGSINEVYDLLVKAELSVIGEEIFRVDHCLVAVDDIPIANIRRVLSHPQALAQCFNFLNSLENCKSEPHTDTAMAVQKVREDNDLAQAAIASEEAARLYGLTVLKRGLADQRDNYTRFLIVAREPREVDLRIPAKTSLVLATPHEEGALLSALNTLHGHKLNLTKLESRPRPGVPFQYLFYIDFEGNRVEERVTEALRTLRASTAFLKILGSYPMEERGKTEPRPAAVAAVRAKSPELPRERRPAAESLRRIGVSLVGRHGPGQMTVTAENVRFGDGNIVVVAGPGVVASEEQIHSSARRIREAGATVLRGGCFDPNRPADEAGLDEDRLRWLSEAGRQYGLPVATEAVSPEDVPLVATHAAIVLIGARHMQNYALLRAAGRVNKPVILKRGPMATIEELLKAAEAIAKQGNQQIILCERGIRTFEGTTRHTLDLASLATLRDLTPLPVLVDPSHAADRPDVLVQLALAARALHPDGLMLRVHADGEPANGAQPLDFATFGELVGEIYTGGEGAASPE